jgi:hypothetical protein
MIAARRARRRDYHVPVIFLDGPALDSSSTSLSDTLADPRSKYPAGLEAEWRERVDVQRIVARLPTLLARLCRALMTANDLQEAARLAKVSRATLYRSLPELRRQLAPLRSGPVRPATPRRRTGRPSEGPMFTEAGLSPGATRAPQRPSKRISGMGGRAS